MDVNVIPQSEPLIQMKKTAPNRYSIGISQSVKNFIEAIPKEKRKGMTLRIIPKDSPEGRRIMGEDNEA